MYYGGRNDLMIKVTKCANGYLADVSGGLDGRVSSSFTRLYIAPSPYRLGDLIPEIIEAWEKEGKPAGSDCSESENENALWSFQDQDGDFPSNPF